MQVSRKVTIEDVWILDGKTVVQPPDLGAWKAWMEDEEAQRIVRMTKVGPIVIKTMFMGFDMRLGLRSLGLPEVFLTVVGGMPDGMMQKRATSYRQAEAMHEEAIGCAAELLRPEARA